MRAEEKFFDAQCRSCAKESQAADSSSAALYMANTEQRGVLVQEEGDDNILIEVY